MIISLIKEKLKDLDVDVLLPPKHLGQEWDISIILFRELKRKNKDELINRILESLGNLVDTYEFINGYLNIRLNYDTLIKLFNDLFNFKNKNKKILIEHTSVNPNKALHIGHLRNSLLGDVLNRLLTYVGYKTEVHNYIDDTGSQVADIVVGVYYFGFPEDPSKISKEDIANNVTKYSAIIKAKEVRDIINERERTLKNLYGYEVPKKLDHYFGDYVYVIVNRLYSIDGKLINLQKEVLRSIEEQKDPIYTLSRKLTKKILLEQLKTLWRLEIYYDLLVKESDILKLDLWAEAFEILKSNNIIEIVKEGEKKNTWSIDLEKLGYKGYTDKYKVLVRSDGTTVYLAKDIAYAMWKHGLLKKNFKYSIFTRQPNGKELWETNENGINKNFGNADMSINIIGIEQKYLQDIIEKIIDSISKGNKKYVFYGYSHVMLSKNTAKLFGIEDNKEFYKMSGRKGVFINVDNFLEVLEKRVKDTLINRGLDKEYVKKIYRSVARSILSIEMLRYSRSKPIIFDLDSMVKIEEGSAIYIVYTFARINSLLKKAKEVGIECNLENYNAVSFKNLNNVERKLLKQLFLFKDFIYKASSNLDVTILFDYLFDISRTFNEFYQNYPILKDYDKNPHRFYIVCLTHKVLKEMFYILKIDEIEKI